MQTLFFYVVHSSIFEGNMAFSHIPDPEMYYMPNDFPHMGQVRVAAYEHQWCSMESLWSGQPYHLAC